jgi:hypothetical protein
MGKDSCSIKFEHTAREIDYFPLNPRRASEKDVRTRQDVFIASRISSS